MRLATLVAATVLASCSLLSRGITAEEAGSIALERSELQETHIVEVRLERRPELPLIADIDGRDPEGRVWLVTLEGFDGCRPRDFVPCQRFPAISYVYFDVATGAIVQESTSGRRGG
jgi:hypothetical protein